MKTSLYNQIRNKVLGLLLLIMPFFLYATPIAGPSSHKADYGSINLTDQVVSSSTSGVTLNSQSNYIQDSSINTFSGSSQYTLNNLLNRNSHQNFISIKSVAAPPTIVCPGAKISNTDPGFCRAAVSGLAATISDPDGDITTLTWTMSGATIAVSPISGINNILGSFNFLKGVTTVTYRVTDALGSSVTCSFTVTVSDKEIPSIVCPADANLTIPSCASLSDPISFFPLSVSDNCGINIFTSNPVLPKQFPLGSTPVIFTASDVSGNSAQCTQIITVVNEAALSLTTSSTPVSCFGGNNGTATVAVTGGSPSYTYSWNTVPVQTTSTATNLTAGTYTVTVTDFYGCTATASVTVAQPAAALSVAVAIQINVICFGSSTGSVTVAGNGGTAAYQYSINGVLFQASATFPGLAAGVYTITVKDSRNCINTTTATITQPATAVAGAITSQTNVSCVGTATGSATILGSGGTPPYQYNINGGAFQVSGTFSSLIAGTYNVIVRDANNCAFGLSVTITQSASALSASITSKTNVACAAANTGSATVTASGGTSPYTYSWNTVPVQTNATAINLTARAYIVTVRDATGCIVTANVTITQPTPIVVIVTHTDVACFGDLTGTATASASGGNPPYTYAWLTTPLQTTATATNLAAGSYTVAVFDASGCYKSAFVTILQPATKLTASITNQVNVVCAGSNTGSITVSGSGGIAPIQYNINGGAFQASGTFSSLAGGSYTIIAKDANNCTVTIPAIITAPASPLAASITSSTNVACAGANTGSATVTASGGTSPYTYSWNTVPVQTNATAINLIARAYIVTVRDAVGCVTTANVTITQPSPIVVTVSHTDVACFGDLTGTATASASGGNPPYTYAWLTTPLQTTAIATNLAAGSYTVAVFDASGCYKSAFVTISQPAAKLIASITNQVNVVCAGNNIGSITVAGSGGVAPIQYNINGGAFQASGTFNNLAGGAYTIIAKDANNCTVTIPATITAPASALAASITSSTNVACAGGATGSSTVAANGGTSPYTYSWNSSPVQTNATANNLIAGTYIVTVTDAAGCIATLNVTITQPTLIVVTATKTNIACFGDLNGTASASASGGVSPYTFTWTTVPVQTTATATNLAAGTYTVAVTDASGCIKSTSVTITQPAAKLIASITNQVNVVCAGNNIGSITVSGSGGVAPIQYNINGGAFQASGTFNNLAGGAYTIIAKDANNCSVTIPATITAPASALAASITSSTNVACAGGATGSATAAANGGTSPYTYSWNSSPVQTNATANNLIAGTYIVTVTDAAGCIATPNVTITQPTLIVVTATKTNIACFGDLNGTASASASGGVSPYTFTWTTVPVQTTATATNLAAGTYTVAVTDASGCIKSTSVTITQPAAKLIASITNQVNVVCAGNNIGSITVSGSGGVAPIQYNINGGAFQASGTFNNLAGGAYTIIAKDANNCSVTIPATITAPASALAASITSSTNVACAGGVTGSATAAANGGTSPYTYSWNSSPVQNNATANNLVAGAYTVTVTDAVGCVATADVTITEPAPIVITTTNTNVSCFGDATGTAAAEVSGGVSPYTFAWTTTPVQTTATATNLAAGTYSVAVTDASGCIKSTSVTITQPAAKLIASITNQVNVVCAGINNGSITVAGSGGVAPIQYNINGGAFQASGTFNNLAGGAYTIIAKDANNCTVTIPATITAPASALAASITSSTNVACAGGATGSSTVAANGGTSPYTYSWNSTPVQTNATANNLVAGAYTVTVSDAAGCIATANVTITEPAPIILTTTRTNIACFGDATGTATIEANGGVSPYTFAWTTVPVQTTATATNLAAGSYTVAVIDASGCFKSSSVTITQPLTQLAISITDQVNVVCAGINNGSITVSGSGGIAPIQYNINGGAFQATGIFDNLAGGAYTIIAKDANNCTVTIPATITAPASALAASITSSTNVACAGGATGSSTVAANGGTSPYTYSWNSTPVQTNATANNLVAGAYTVTVTDAAGCIATANVTITEPAPIILTTTRTNIACFGDATGTATIEANGGVSPYTFAWTTVPVQTTATATNLAAGSYTVAVIDASGCFKSSSVTITQPLTQLAISITDQVNVACAGNTGSVTVDGSGGILPYQYNIDGGAFQASGIFSNLSAGVYSVNVKDANNCTVNVAVTITEPANALHASITDQVNVLCAGLANGSASVTAVDGATPYSYSWNTVPVQTAATASNLAAGTYIVTTTDKLSCFVENTVVITEPALALSATITNQVNFDCATGTNGSVTVEGAGGTPNYQYKLDGGSYQVSGIFTDLPAGSYIVTVRDTNNCESPVPIKIITTGLVLAVNDSFTTTEDTQLDANVMTNDQVLCNLPITVTANTSPLNGSVAIKSDGTFTYIPSLNYNGTDSFDYTITDNAGGSSTTTVTITINPVNDPPVTLNDSITVKYNTPTTGNILSNGHIDPDGTTLTVNTAPLVDPANGTFVIAADGTYTYSPNLNYTGNDLIIISLCDAGIPLPPACTNDTLFITVYPPNQPPVIVPEHIGLCQDGTFTGTSANGGTVFNGDTDPENNLPLTVNTIPIQDALHGIFSITDAITGTFNYTPNSGYSGSDIVVVSICDSGIPVACSNDTIYIEVLTAVVADAGFSQKLCNSDVAFLVGNSPGTASGSWNVISGPNTPSISPATGNVATVSGLIASPVPYVFGYSIDNGGCVSTDTMSVINYPPATPAFAGNDQTFCDGTGNVTATFEGNTPLNGTGIWSQLSGPGAATIVDPTNPNSNVSDLSSGTYTFQWLISNGVCQDNADAVNITVSQPATVNAGSELSTCESAPVPILDADAQNSSSIMWSTTGNGTFDDPTIINPVYTPGTLDLTMGSVKLFLTAKTNSPCLDVSAFTILTVNKTPLANAGPDEGSICVGTSKTITGASASGYSTLQWTATPDNAGTLTNAETLNPTFTPAAGFSGAVVLTLQVQGLGSCNMVTASDDMTIVVSTSLVANAGPDQTILPGTTAALSGLVSGGSGFYSWSWQPSGLLVNSLIENPVSLSLNSDTTFILTVLDITSGCTDDDSVNIIMDTRGIPIIAVGDHDSTLVNVPVTINVLANDINPDGDPLIVSVCGFPAHGIVILNSDNTFTYTPYSDYEGEDAFCYQICSTINPNYCADTIVQLRVKPPSLDDLHAYTGISPNSDGINDVWKIQGIEKYPNNSVLVFNRWGDKLREFSNYNNTTHSWNGKNENGDPLPDGTYFYILDVKDVGVLKGWIYLRGK